MDTYPLCTANGCRLPALFQARHCRQHLPDAVLYHRLLPGLLREAAGANLARVDLRHAEIRDADLSGAILTGALLDGAQITGTTLTRATLRGASARGAVFCEIDAEGLDAEHAIFTATRWLHARLDDGLFAGSIWSSSQVRGVEFVRADFTGAVLRHTIFSQCTLTDAWLTLADLTEAEIDACDLSWAILAGARGESLSLQRSALGNVNGVGAFFDGAEFSEVQAAQARFSAATLTGARFTEADLSKAIFREADLRGADLRGADLHGAILERANLESATLAGTCLDNANLNGAIIE